MLRSVHHGQSLRDLWTVAGRRDASVRRADQRGIAQALVLPHLGCETRHSDCCPVLDPGSRVGEHRCVGARTVRVSCGVARSRTEMDSGSAGAGRRLAESHGRRRGHCGVGSHGRAAGCNERTQHGQDAQRRDQGSDARERCSSACCGTGGGQAAPRAGRTQITSAHREDAQSRYLRRGAPEDVRGCEAAWAEQQGQQGVGRNASENAGGAPGLGDQSGDTGQDLGGAPWPPQVS